MRVAVLTSPIVFQAKGGLQIQIVQTVEALVRQGVCVRLIDPLRERFTDFDLLHVFGATNGNHRIAEFGRAFGLPVVTSPLLHVDWTASLGRRARLLDRLVRRLTHWNVKTEYAHIQSCFENSNALIALGSVERQCMRDAFEVPNEKIHVIPNGIPGAFFEASPELFVGRTGIQPGFVLCVGSVDPYKNQLGLARAIEGSERQLVVIGQCLPNNADYLRQLTSLPNVRYLGGLDYGDPLLASAYAAAGVFCLVSEGEVMPLVVIESLAAGTPAILTKKHSMDTAQFARWITEVDSGDVKAIRAAVSSAIRETGDRQECRQSLRHLTWDRVAAEICTVYERVLGSRS